MSMKWIQCALVVTLAAFVLALPSAVHADEAADEAAAAEAKAAAAFEKGVVRVVGYFQREKCDKGLKELKKLLKKHERKPYVVGRRAVLSDLTRRLAFGAKYKHPSANDVMEGKVELWEPSKGRIKIRYKSDQAGDFRRPGGRVLVFPADTRGPFVLQVWGKKFPTSMNRAPWMKFVGDTDPHTKKYHAFEISFGSPKRMQGDREVWLPARVTHIHGKMQKVVSKKDDVPAALGRPYKVELKVTDTHVTAGVNGKIVGKARKPTDTWGWVGFQAPTWSTLIFSGYIEPAYVQERIDKIVQTNLREFRKAYKREEHLPDWLFETKATAPTTEQKDLPVDLDKKHWSSVRLVNRQIKNKEWEAVGKQLESLTTEGVPASVIAWLRAQTHAEQGDDEAALTCVEQCLRAAPDFLKGLLLRGKTLGRLRRTDEAMATFQAALAKHTDDPQAYEASAFAMLLAGRSDAAQKIAEMAARRGVVSKQLDELALIVVKATKGPLWPKVFEHKSRNYHVFSDISKSACQEASKLLEQSLTSYKVNFHWVSRDKLRLFPVYVFSGQIGFMQYVADLQGLMGKPNEHVAGLYSGILKQLLIWNLPDKQDMLETIRHEGFHQYLDRFMPDPPTWINEGLAVYHENAKSVRGSLKFGQLHPRRHALLMQKGFINLEDFVNQSHPEYYKGGLRSYAQAWALVHFFKHGKTRWRKMFDQIVKDMQAMSSREVLAKHFTPATLKELDPAFRAYVRGLKP